MRSFACGEVALRRTPQLQDGQSCAGCWTGVSDVSQQECFACLSAARAAVGMQMHHAAVTNIVHARPDAATFREQHIAIIVAATCASATAKATFLP
jgi:hypothetical protein